MVMAVNDLVRIVAHEPDMLDRTGMSGRIVARTAHDVTLRLTSTCEIVSVRVDDLLPVDPRPMSVRAWRQEHAPWRQRNQRVIDAMRERVAA
ncbi:MAG: hypothetical protein M3440_15205 [Chloroflexota bacterium]|nr:hypothetical protein [Chloroflexota bacterium]